MKYIGFLFLTIVTVGIILFVIFFLLSPGKVKLSWKEKTGIAEKIFMEIGGTRQGMIIESKNIANPVLLVLHGGPGSTEYFAFKKYKVCLENSFTVCYWEQRGAGISYSSDIDERTMNLDQFIRDTIDVTNYLRERFQKEKIFLMGHSWGTLLGSYVIKQNPGLYHAYIAVGQMANTVESEKEIYEFIHSSAIEKGDKAALKELESYNPNNDNFPFIDNYLGIRAKYALKYGGGIMRNKTSLAPFIMIYLSCKAYTINEKINFLNGQFFSNRLLFREARTENPNLLKDIPSQEIPVFILMGKYDYQTTYNQAKIYYEALEAPKKSFYSFENSAHSPMFEEPEYFMDIVNGILIHF